MKHILYKNKFKDEDWRDLPMGEKVDIIISRVIWGTLAIILMAGSAAIALACLMFIFKVVGWVIE